jgi:hypothetical protein
VEPGIVNHLFLTTQYLVKGEIKSGGKRLSDFLQHFGRPFVPVHNATLYRLDSADQIVTTAAWLRLSDVILAYEFLDLAGDTYRRTIGEHSDQEFQMAGIQARLLPQLEVVGKVRAEALRNPETDGFFIMRNPVVRGIHRDGTDFDHLGRLPYAIVHWAQVHCIFPYT